MQTPRIWQGLTAPAWARRGDPAGSPPSRLELGLYAALLLAAAIMRLWDLGSRAMHHDESLHAFYSWALYMGEGYGHNPMMHGPFQMEATAGAFWLLGDSDFTARILYAVAGTVLVALPFLFRARLGALGALLISAMLAFSPAMLYFSRFARNDILMAVWALGLVICMWRYLDEGKSRYLYIASALLALAFATKETAYMLTATLGLYLFLVLAARNLPAITRDVAVGEVSTPLALSRVLAGAWATAARAVTVPAVSRHGGLLALLITLTLPMWAALVAVFQGTPLLSWSGLVLAASAEGPGPIGAPLRGGIVIAFLAIVILIGVSVYVGHRWNSKVWWNCALVFYAIWIPLYTTFFTNIVGIGSGMWQSLGYWLVQQGEGRGGQPWYYYFVIGSTYEFLPLLFAIAGGIYYLRRRDPFGHFLVFWAATTFILYSAASEKMPWLLVNVTLPLIVLSGRFLGEVVGAIRWRRLASRGGLLLLPGVPSLLVLLWMLAFFDPGSWEASDALLLAGLFGIAAGLIAVGVWLARRTGRRDFLAFAAVPLALVLVVLSVRAGWNAAYKNGDIPVEMIVYTQTSPDVARLARDVQRVRRAASDGRQILVTIDGTSGFHWPWRWYFRDHEEIGYPSYDGSPLRTPPDSDVVLVHSQNQPEAEATLVGDQPSSDALFTRGVRIRHRWWFPENYKGLTPGQFLKAFVDRKSWRNAMDYFLHRKFSQCSGMDPRNCLGSEDSYVYFSLDYPSAWSPVYK